MTPLHWACKRGHFDIAKVLIDNGSIVNAIDIVIILNIYVCVKIYIFKKIKEWKNSFIFKH